MKFCTHCGAQNGDEALFCTSCGQRMAGETSPAEEKQPAQTDFTPETPAVTVKNDTPLTLKTLRKFYNSLKIGGIVMIVCGVLLVVLGALEPILDPEEGDYVFLFFGIVFVCCGFIYLCLYYGVYTKNKMFTDKTHALYLCDEEGITQIEYDGDRETGKHRISYAQISKVTKKKEYLLLRFGAQAWLVNRNTYILGTDADFLALLRRRCAPNSVKVK